MLRIEAEPLALGPIARVERAPCGHVHLHVGPVTVRLSPSAAASVSETLAEAVRVLELDPELARGCTATHGH
ncbi:MAG: hypothetical protein VYE22_25880 [Myxococcota bacterium]|mgnify:CR=1 FL=1|nr:hypothetical protein [Myxococcota bacterium]